MEVQGWNPPSLGDEELSAQAPMVRAELVKRLEQIWKTCSPHIDGSLPRPDPRYIEAGLRVLDRLTNLYRLNQPARGGEEPPDTVVDGRRLVLGKLAELTERESASDSAPGG